MKFLVHSNAPWMGTGYGTQGREMARHLMELGHMVSMSANVGVHQIEASFSLWKDGPPVSLRPAGSDDSGSSVIVGHVQSAKPDYVISLYDACGLQSRAPGGVMGGGWGRHNFRWVPYAMVDDGPPLARYHKDTLQGASVILALTHFAEQQLNGWATVPVLYAPHSLDPDFYSPGDKAKARAELGLAQTRFIVGFIGKTEGWPGRKGLLETVWAFRQLGEEVGWKNVCIYLKTDPVLPDHDISLAQIRQEFEIPFDSWKQETTYHYLVGRSHQHMVQLYRAMDVVCLPSKAEAFGLTSVEAEMCGTPTIVTDSHASRETSYGPWRVPSGVSFTSWKLSNWCFPNRQDVYQAMLDAYNTSPARRGKFGAEAREHAVLNYGTDGVREHWRGVTKVLQDRLAHPKHITTHAPEKKSQIAVIIPFVGDDTRAKRVAEAFGATEILLADDSFRVGYPTTMNAAAARAKAPWILIWNDDAVPGDGMLERLYEMTLKHSLSIAAPVVTRTEEGQAQTELAWEVHPGGVRSVVDPWHTGEIWPLTAPLYQSLFLIKREVWQWALGFDERYNPGYYEDADLFRRIQSSGYRAAVVPEARCIHEAGQTFNRLYKPEEVRAILERNRDFFNWKFGGY